MAKVNFSDVSHNLDASMSLSAQDVKIVLAIGFFFMVALLSGMVYKFYRKAYKETVETNEISQNEFVRISVWPITLFAILMIMAFGGGYILFYMPSPY